MIQIMADFAIQITYISNMKSIKCGKKMGGDSFPPKVQN